ncbi:MAG: biopolymer transporter ExbD [Pseudomonadota bacterium]
MQLEIERVRRKRLSMTPLIDVIFLLLLFFMLSSTFLKFSRIDVSAGTAAQGAAAMPAPEIIIRVGADQSLDLNGDPVDPLKLVEALQTIPDIQSKTVVIVAREKALVQDLITTLDEVKKAYVGNIALVR